MKLSDAIGSEAFRTFIAIELPADLRLRILDHINHLRRDCPEVKASWGRENNLHLTLKFLGNIQARSITALSEAAGEAAATCEPFDLIVSGCGFFPRRAKPNVLWIGVHDLEHRLHALHQALEEQCSAAGFGRDARAFHPHLTIARLRNPAGGRSLAEAHEALDFAPQRFTVSEIVVFKSELLREGSRHTALSRHEFGTKAACEPQQD